MGCTRDEVEGVGGEWPRRTRPPDERELRQRLLNLPHVTSLQLSESGESVSLDVWTTNQGVNRYVGLDTYLVLTDAVSDETRRQRHPWTGDDENSGDYFGVNADPERHRRALYLLSCLVDDDDCWFDHHGGCQAHGFLNLSPGEKCPNSEARRLLDELIPNDDG